MPIQPTHAPVLHLHSSKPVVDAAADLGDEHHNQVALFTQHHHGHQFEVHQLTTFPIAYQATNHRPSSFRCSTRIKPSLRELLPAAVPADSPWHDASPATIARLQINTTRAGLRVRASLLQESKLSHPMVSHGTGHCPAPLGKKATTSSDETLRK